MVDISNLGITAEPEFVASEEYVGASFNNEPIPAGTYIGRFIDGEFKGEGNDRLLVRPGTVTSKKNDLKYLSAEFALEVTDGSFARRRVYGRANTIPQHLIFNKTEAGRENTNQLMDHIRGAGFTGSLATAQEYMDALESLVLRSAPVRFSTDWQAYCSPNSKEYRGDGQSVRGMKKFPPAEGGKFNPRVTVTTTFGEDVVLLAKNEIKGIYPPKA
jgi:hypothetical protein